MIFLSQNTINTKFLEEICNAFGPSGFETQVQTIIHNYGKQFADEVLFDRLGSVIFKRGSNGPKIMLAGHSDEIGFIISEIVESGFLKISNIGGWWSQTLLNTQLLIKPFKGEEKIIGIITAKPPHILSSEERNKVVELKQMFVDIGCNSKEEVEALGLRIGDPAIPYGSFRTMKRTRKEKKDGKSEEREVNLAVSKAFDDRIGAFIVTEVLRRLFEENIDHPNTIYSVSSTQEEIGLRGARTSAQMIQPDIGFALDVDISGDVPGTTGIVQKMGQGVSISAMDGSMIPNPIFRKFVIEVAEEEKIKWQPAFLPAGGTDAGIIHLTGIGAPSIFIGVPTRHIHSHHSMLDLDDVQQAVNLLIAVIKRLDKEKLKEFITL
ncbi:MAG: putative aminopeptidase YsdC [Candidatus Heimdallarchaeota archaeon LC_3]|nr:MAG: putative aminopeptidase YsdC [Candidatus Heimdallarchaeota archaeon LC_3]